MTELEQAAADLEDLKKLISKVNVLFHKLPRNIVQPDLEELREYIIRLQGYIDCMVNFQIELLPFH